MTTTIRQAIDDITGLDQPLAHLTKEELFVYTKADNSKEAMQRFMQEVIRRRGVYAEVNNKVEEAKTALADAHLKLVRNSDHPEPYKRQVEHKKKALGKALEAQERLALNPDALSHEEIQAHYRSRHITDFHSMMAEFTTQQLFRCHGSGWASFLVCTREDRDKDERIFKDFEALALLCGEEDTKEFKVAAAFYRFRIEPSMFLRRRFTDQEGAIVNVASLKEDLKKAYWEAWRRYNTATVNYKWADESGVAFDDRLFKVNAADAVKEEGAA